MLAELVPPLFFTLPCNASVTLRKLQWRRVLTAKREKIIIEKASWHWLNQSIEVWKWIFYSGFYYNRNFLREPSNKYRLCEVSWMTFCVSYFLLTYLMPLVFFDKSENTRTPEVFWCFQGDRKRPVASNWWMGQNTEWKATEVG